MTGLALSLATRAGWLPPDDAVLQTFLRRCEDPVLGLRLRPDAATTSAGTLWGGLVLARAVRARPRYADAASKSLVLLQRPDGGLGERHRAISTLAATWRGLDAAALLDRLRSSTLGAEPRGRLPGQRRGTAHRQLRRPAGRTSTSEGREGEES